MKRILLAPQAQAALLRLPPRAYRTILECLEALLAWPDANAPGTLGIDPETRLRAFGVSGYVVTYSPPRGARGRLHVFRIARKR